MEILKKREGNNLLVEFYGSFTFEDKDAFYDIAFSFTRDGIKTMEIDCRDLKFIDSSGIGMLLILLDDSKSVEGSQVIIKNISGSVKTIFERSEMGRIFTIV